MFRVLSFHTGLIKYLLFPRSFSPPKRGTDIPPSGGHSCLLFYRKYFKIDGFWRTRQAAGGCYALRAPSLSGRPPTLTGKRDRALLLLGFAGAFRRAELVALTVADLAFVDDGLRITIRKSKTDQEGAGQVIAIPHGSLLFCPVTALKNWLAAAGIREGAVFRAVGKGSRVGEAALSDKSVANVVKRYAGAVGLEAADFAGHSLRAGFVTSAAEAGASIFKMAEVSRHRSTDVLAGYVRSANLFKDHAGADLL